MASSSPALLKNVETLILAGPLSGQFLLGGLEVVNALPEGLHRGLGAAFRKRFGRAEPVKYALNVAQFSAERLLGTLHGIDFGIDVPAQIVHGRGKLFVLAGEAVGKLVGEAVSGSGEACYLLAQLAALSEDRGLRNLSDPVFG